MFETQKFGDKTSSGKIGLNIKPIQHTNPPYSNTKPVCGGCSIKYDILTYLYCIAEISRLSYLVLQEKSVLAFSCLKYL